MSKDLKSALNSLDTFKISTEKPQAPIIEKLDEQPMSAGPDIVDTLHELEIRVANAPLERIDHLVVSDKIYYHLFKDGGKSGYYKGIELFKPGTRTAILKERGLKAEEFYDMKTKQQVSPSL